VEATLLGVALTSVMQAQLQYALPLAGGVTLYVAGTDLLPEVNREPNWRMALLVFAGVASLLILQRLVGAFRCGSGAPDLLRGEMAAGGGRNGALGLPTGPG